MATAAIAVSVVAIGTVVALALTEQTASTRSGGTIVWQKPAAGDPQPPRLDCGTPQGLGTSRTTSVRESGTPQRMLRSPSCIRRGMTRSAVMNRVSSRIRREDLVPIWRFDSELGPSVSLLLTVDGANVAIINVERPTIVAGKQIPWATQVGS